jgi:hypothetical protein
MHSNHIHKTEIIIKDYFMLRNAHIEDCKIILQVAARNLFFTNITFRNCEFIVKKELKNFMRWNTCHLEGCSFEGVLRGNRFGAKSLETDYEGVSGLVNCDFTKATLDACDFYECCEMETIKLPIKDHLFFYDRAKNLPTIKHIEWNGKLNVIFRAFDTVPVLPTQRLVVKNLPRLIKDYGGSVEEIYEKLKDYDFIQMEKPV